MLSVGAGCWRDNLFIEWLWGSVRSSEGQLSRVQRELGVGCARGESSRDMSLIHHGALVEVHK